MNIQISSLKCADPNHRKERVINDLKYSMGKAAVATAGVGTAAAVISEPGLIKDATKIASQTYQKASATLKPIIAKVTNSSAWTKLTGLANKITQLGIYKSAIQPAINFVKTKSAGLVKEAGKLYGTISAKLAHIPTQYKVAGVAILTTLALLSNLDRKEAYNEGKIDAKYGA